MENKVNATLFKSSSAGTHVDCGEDELDVRFKYTKTSWVFITFFGTTRMPFQIDFICKKSGELFESVTDKDRIEHFMRFRRV